MQKGSTQYQCRIIGSIKASAVHANQTRGAKFDLHSLQINKSIHYKIKQYQIRIGAMLPRLFLLKT